jgi:hypothetical protein
MGQPVSDPLLAAAVRGLASEILSNRLRMPGIAFNYAIGAVSGAVGIVAIALSASGQHGHTETVRMVLAVVAFINVISSFLWRPRQMRRKAAEALRVNSEG